MNIYFVEIESDELKCKVTLHLLLAFNVLIFFIIE